MARVLKLSASIIAFFCSRLLSAQLMWQISEDTVVVWQYTGGDEFNGPAIDTSKWAYAFAWSRSIASNREQQYYSDGANHILKDGVLSLFAKKETVTRRLRDWSPDNDSIFFSGKFNGLNKREFAFTSGMLRSKKTFQFGYFEIKFKMPAQKGFWPAFWLFGGYPNEEIDIMELKTEKRNKIHVARYSTKREENYLRKGLAKRQWGGWIKIKGDLTKGYYIMSCEWTPEHVKWFLNGELIAYTRVSLTQRKELAVNIAVPSDNGPFKPGPGDTVSNSGTFDIDYIRIWDNTGASKDVYANTTNTAHDIAISELISKGNFLYGKEKQRSEGGLTVSVFRNTADGLEITVLGDQIPQDAVIRILDENGAAVFSDSLRFGHITIDPAHLRGTRKRLELRSYGKTVDAFVSDL